MRRYIAASTLVTALTLAACGGSGASQTMDAAMQRDLEAVQAGTIEMAPNAQGQMVVSAVEQTGRTQSRPTAPAPRAQVVSRVAEREEPDPRPEPVIAQPAPADVTPTATRPTSAPRVSPPPPGGYKTVGEVIRNAPFPIKP